MSGSFRRWGLGLLVTALAGLLAGVWATDRPSPVYPHGEFGPLLLGTVLIVAIIAGLVGLWRSARGR